MDESALSGLVEAMDRGRCVSGRSALEALRKRPSKSRSRSGICTRGRKGPRSLLLCRRAERGAGLAACVLIWYTGSVLRALRAGRLCRNSDIELSDERARDSLVRGRMGTVSSRPDEPASCRPRREERRRRGFLLCEAGLE
jgi:hypothetical protein